MLGMSRRFCKVEGGEGGGIRFRIGQNLSKVRNEKHI